MSLRTTVGKADLLRFLQQDNTTNLDQIAGLFGLERVGSRQPKEKKETNLSAPTGPVPEPLTQPTPAVENKPCLSHWLPVHYEAKNPPTEAIKAPAWITEAAPFEPSADERQAPPPTPPLTPWPRLWPFLRKTLGGLRETRQVDVDRLVRLMAQGHAIQSFPRQKRPAWAPQCQILVDLDERLSPFWADFWRLLAGLEHLRGTDGLDVYLFRSGPEGPFRRRGGRQWLDEAYLPPPQGCPILVLSDLGFYAQRHLPRLAWLALGERLHQLGHRPTALLPCPPRLWHGALLYPWRAICWDRVPLKQGRAWTREDHAEAETDPIVERGLVELLQATAPAIRVEPGLLRALRLLLPLDKVDVGSEAQVWHHADVASNPIAMLLKPEGDIIERMRNGFRAIQDDTLKGEILNTIAHFHGFLPQEIGQEECLIRRDLMGEALTQADMTFLGSYIQTRRKYGTTDLFGDAVGRWFNRLQSRLHDSMAMMEPIATAVHWEKRVLQGQEDVAVPAGVDGLDFAWMYDQAAQATHWEFRADGRGMRLQPKGLTQTQSLHRANADFQLKTLSFQLSTQQHSVVVEVEPTEAKHFPEPKGDQFRISTDHQTITFQKFQKPHWATMLRKDLRGLTAKTKDNEGDERELVWLSPGPIHLESPGEPSDSLSKTWVHAQGCWLDSKVYDRLIPDLSRPPTLEKPPWADDFGCDDFGIYADLAMGAVKMRLRFILPGGFTWYHSTKYLAVHPQEILIAPYWLSQAFFPKPILGFLDALPVTSFSRTWAEAAVSWNALPEIFEALNSRVSNGTCRLPHDNEWYFATQSEKARQLPPRAEQAIVGSLGLTPGIPEDLGQPNIFGINGLLTTPEKPVWLSNGKTTATAPTQMDSFISTQNTQTSSPSESSASSGAFPFYLAMDF